MAWVSVDRLQKYSTMTYNARTLVDSILYCNTVILYVEGTVGTSIDESTIHYKYTIHYHRYLSSWIVDNNQAEGRRVACNALDWSPVVRLRRGRCEESLAWVCPRQDKGLGSHIHDD